MTPIGQKPVAPEGYAQAAVALHWLTAFAVLAAFVLAPGGSEQRVYSAAKDFDRALHEILGLSVFFLTFVRLAWRASGRMSRPPEPPGGLDRAARIVQGTLYGLLLATPLAGVTGAWLEGHPLTLGLLGSVPPMLPQAHSAGQLIAAIHTTLGDAVMWLAGLHAAAALFHHFVLRDRVLLGMLPRRWR